MKIYTKTGDRGSTSLIGGQRAAKNDVRLEAYGTIDELNAQLGLLRSRLSDKHIAAVILDVQNMMFVIGAQLACSKVIDAASVPQYAHVTTDKIAVLEQEIDAMDVLLPRLNSFVIYGDNELSALAHVCRAVCRRAERTIVTVLQENFLEPELLQYINRLSDYLFVLARFLSENEKKADFSAKK